MKNGKRFPVPVRVNFSCKKCPAYCCTYDEIAVTRRDIERLARHHGIEPAEAEERFTRAGSAKGERLLLTAEDTVFDIACVFLDRGKRACGVYEARPAICRDFPGGSRCGYYDFLKFERLHQDDPQFIALT